MKENISIAIIGSKAEEFCKKAGKKGGESDYRLWHSVVHDKVLTFCEPFRWPEKLVSLIYCLNLSQQVVIAEDKANPAFGEALVALDLMDKKQGCFATEYGLEQYATNTIAEKYEVKSFDDALEWVRERESKVNNGETKVLVDSSFNVKGVGQVLLGFVERGTIKIHDKLTAYPSGAKIMVRSIQVQDKNVEEAPCYSRVGLCFKGASVEEITRGQVLSPSEIPIKKELELNSIKKSKYAKELPSHVHASIGLQNIPCEVEWGEDKAIINFKEQVAFDNEKILFYDLNRAMPRVLASGKTD